MAMPKKQEYAWRGYGSMRPHPQGQTQFPGLEGQQFHDLGGEEMLTDRQRASGAEKTHVSQGEITRRMGAHLDTAFGAAADRRHQENTARMHEAMRGPIDKPANWEPDTSPIHMEGQDWYDPASEGSHAHGVAQMAKEFDMPYHTVAYTKANTAQNIDPRQENVVTRQILEQHAAGVDPKDTVGSTYGDVVVRAAAHAAAPEGANPLETRARNPRSIHEQREDIPFALGHGYKKPGYGQSYVHPWDDRTRPAIDRHMFRAGTDMSEAEIKRAQMGASPPTKNTDTGLAGGSPSPAHRMVDAGVRRAAKKRGLNTVEAQTGIWHVVNPQGGPNPETPVNPNQFKFF